MAPVVLVLDEGTASLDGALEQRTLCAIDELLSHATRIVVSHRALSAAHFDLILDFPRGCAC